MINSMLSVGYNVPITDAERMELERSIPSNDEAFMKAVHGEYKWRDGHLSLSDCKKLVRSWSLCTDEEWNEYHPNNPTWSF